METFINQYKHYEKEAERYLAGMYALQDEFDIELELGWIERSYWVSSLVVDGSIRIQVYKSGYDWGGVSDDLIDLPECVDTKLAQLREKCESIVTKNLIEQQERYERNRVEREHKEQQEFLRLKAKFESKGE